MTSRRKASPRKGLWISIDGTEGVGKSILANHLKMTRQDAIVVPEFSDSPTGQFLHRAVQTHPHFITSSPLEQSLLFLGDFFRLYDELVVPSLAAGRLIVSDRGFLSKIVYQHLVLSSVYATSEVREILKRIFNLVRPPDLIIYLSCDEETQVRRLFARDGHCEQSRIVFIRDANKTFEDYLSSDVLTHVHILQDANWGPEQLIRAGETAINRVL